MTALTKRCAIASLAKRILRPSRVLADAVALSTRRRTDAACAERAGSGDTAPLISASGSDVHSLPRLAPGRRQHSVVGACSADDEVDEVDSDESAVDAASHSMRGSEPLDESWYLVTCSPGSEHSMARNSDCARRSAAASVATRDSATAAAIADDTSAAFAAFAAVRGDAGADPDDGAAALAAA